MPRKILPRDIRKSSPSFLIAVVVALALTAGAWSIAIAAPKDGLALGKAELQSIGALEFGPPGILFVADSKGTSVYALEVPAAEGEAVTEIPSIENLDEKIAARLGVGPRDVAIQDMAVQEKSGMIYLSVMRGRGDGAKPVLLTIDQEGKLSELSLAKVRHDRLEITNPPVEDDKSRWHTRELTITDLEFVDGELLIAGLSNEEFNSVLRRTPFPFEPQVAVTGLEIYHGAHGKYETHAPIYSFLPFDVGGKQHLLAGYLCTPLVTFSMDEVRKNTKLRGKTIAELGWGNVPTDMVPYKQDGEDWILVANNRRGPMKFKASDIEAANKKPGITTEVGPRVGLVDHSVPLGHVAQLDRFNDQLIVLLTRDMETGGLNLSSRSSKWL
ncbi:MAG: hypothetical protein K0U98_24320 [Deltaproteobacteria bacterium]|nr:hypothetical protein [Deltaproteobacteria bacterium]